MCLSSWKQWAQELFWTGVVKGNVTTASVPFLLGIGSGIEKDVAEVTKV